MESVAIGLVSEAFGLSALEGAAIGLSQRMSGLTQSYGRRGGSGFSDGVSSKRARTSAVANVVPGGKGNYRGNFKKTRVSVTENALTTHGYRGEHETYGSLSMNGCQYFTVQSANLQMLSHALSVAFLRMIFWKHYRQTYTTTEDYVFPAYDANAQQPNLHNIRVFSKYKLSDGTTGETSTELHPAGLSATSKLEELVGPLSVLLTKDTQGGAYANDIWQFCGYQFIYKQVYPGGTVANYSISPRWSIDEQEVVVDVKHIIHLQNTTRADTGSVFGDAINANPLVGRVFHMHGIYPDVEYQANAHGSADFALALQKFVSPTHLHGIGVPDVNPTGEWQAIPRPQVFANIISCQSGLRLEPGDIKKEFLGFKFRGRFNDLIRGFSYLGTGSSVNTSDLQPIYSSNKLGTCKLFAFEKVMPTGYDAVEMNYHIDRYVNVYFPPSWQVLSVRGEFGTYKFDLQQGTYPVQMLAAPADVVATDVLGGDVKI